MAVFFAVFAVDDFVVRAPVFFPDRDADFDVAAARPRPVAVGFAARLVVDAERCERAEEEEPDDLEELFDARDEARPERPAPLFLAGVMGGGR